MRCVVPYIGTWIETFEVELSKEDIKVVPYIGTWIETIWMFAKAEYPDVVPYIGTWIETIEKVLFGDLKESYLI